MIIFLLAHAGGNSLIYKMLLRGLEPRHRLIPLELPGHGRRMAEAPLHDMEEMLADLLAQVKKELHRDRAHAFFGHSMGGLQAFLLAQSLEDQGYAPPQRLCISSSCPPGFHKVNPDLLRLSDAEFWRESARHFGGTPDEALADSDLMALFAPILRADLNAVVSYRPAGRRPVAAPISAFYGTRDIVDTDDMRQWADWSSEPLTLCRMEGNHFYLLASQALAERLDNELGKS